jgi:hypothetical protein
MQQPLDKRVLSIQLAHGLDYLHCLDANARDAFQEIDHLLLVIREAIGVEFLTDGRVFRRLFLVLVENPFERGAVADLVAPRRRWNARELGLAVKLNVASLPVRAQERFRREFRLVSLLVGDIDPLQLPWLSRFVADVQRHELFAPVGPTPEVDIEWNTWKLALEIHRIFIAIGRDRTTRRRHD